MQKTVDTSRFTIKLGRVKKAYEPVAARVILESAQSIYDKAGENLQGPFIGLTPDPKNPAIGQMPVPARSRKLAKSMQIKPLSPLNVAVYSDEREAPWNKFVHDGVKYKNGTVVRPRRFLGDVIRGQGGIIQTKIKDAIKKAIQSEGRK